jgi:hypothetical protein
MDIEEEDSENKSQRDSSNPRNSFMQENEHSSNL